MLVVNIKAAVTVLFLSLSAILFVNILTVLFLSLSAITAALMFTSTVKPVYSGHLGELDKMTTICR
jgi:hypothetical protein